MIPDTNPAVTELLRRIATEVARREVPAGLSRARADRLLDGRTGGRSLGMNAAAPPFRVNERREYTLADFTSLHGAAFVSACYTALLGRAPDAAGVSHYLALLERGNAKPDIVGRFCRSPEGRKHGAKVHGLLAPWLYHSAARIPVFGYLLHLAVDIATLPLLKRRLRRFEDTAFAQAQQNARALESLARRIDALEDARASDPGPGSGSNS